MTKMRDAQKWESLLEPNLKTFQKTLLAHGVALAKTCSKRNKIENAPRERFFLDISSVFIKKHCLLFFKNNNCSTRRI